MHDFIVIGAGYGGLAAASLLAQAGFDTHILESHIAVGGCASFFKRKDFVFDVGATTLSAVRKDQPLGILFDKLGIKPRLKHLDPGMLIFKDKHKIKRYSELEKWTKEAIEHFGEAGQRSFWQEIYKLNEAGWRLSSSNPRMPPVSFYDLLTLIKPSNIKSIMHANGLFSPLRSLIKKHGLDANESFKDFIDEQLFITVQNDLEQAPYLPAAMGLAYPSETYYPYGGMSQPAEMILAKFKEFSGDISFRSKVTKLDYDGSCYKVTTEKGEEHLAKNIISNIPIWNMAKISSGSIKKYFDSYASRFDFAWGAYTLYFAVEAPENFDLESLYYQVFFEQDNSSLPGKSFFVSFSASDDRARAPAGWRTVTISLHTDVQFWSQLSAEEYSEAKLKLQKLVLDQFDRSFPELSRGEKQFVLPGTPNTFEFFTNRDFGKVGGVPHSRANNLLALAPNQTPFKGLYMVGDTVFPGQGTPSVVLAALNTFSRIVA